MTGPMTGTWLTAFTYDEGTDRISVRTDQREEIEPIVVYWFVWKGIHPETDLYKP